MIPLLLTQQNVSGDWESKPSANDFGQYLSKDERAKKEEKKAIQTKHRKEKSRVPIPSYFLIPWPEIPCPDLH